MGNTTGIITSVASGGVITGAITGGLLASEEVEVGYCTAYVIGTGAGAVTAFMMDTMITSMQFMEQEIVDVNRNRSTYEQLTRSS